MKMAIHKLAATAAVAAMVAVSVPSAANATHQWGHFAAGVGLGLLLGNAAPPVYAPAPVYVQPAPVYVQPRVCYRKEKVCEPYTGCGWRNVQYYC